MKNLLDKAKEFNKRINQLTGYNTLKINTDARNKTISDDNIITYKDMIEDWKQGAYAKDDVRRYNGQAMRCVQAHDSTNNPAWNPSVGSLWTVLHGRTPETAQEWVQPSGAHDMYLAGEYCVYGGDTYICVSGTAYAPGVAGWELAGEASGETHEETYTEPEPEPELEPEPETIANWKTGESVKIGDKRMYNGSIYECIQAHTTQAGWTPAAVASLWRKI